MADAAVRVRRGLYGFASTTFILSMYNVQARGVTTPNVVIGMALFVGGLAQFVAGMWAFAVRNTFSATGACLSPWLPPSRSPSPSPSPQFARGAITRTVRR